MNVNYKIVISSFAQTLSKSITIDNKDTAALYFYESFTINYNILEPEKNTATLMIESRGYNEATSPINPVVDFAGGNIVTIYSEENIIYVGYIASFNISKSANAGTLISLQLNSLLMSLANQVVVNSQSENVVLGTNTYITDFNSNNLQLQYILEWFTNESIISYAAVNILNESPSANNILGLPYVFGNGSENTLDETTKVWFYASSNTTRLDCLQQTLQPYQRVLYQDPSGLIHIEPLTSEMYQVQGGGFSYQFDLTTNQTSTPGTYISNNTPWQSYAYTNNSATISNRAYSMLFPIGINLSSVGPGESSIVAVSTSQTTNNLFPRPTQLLQSGQFEQSTSYSCDLSTQMIQDPTLLTYFAPNTNGGLVASLSGNSSQGTGAVCKIYSQIAMARQLFNESQLTIDVPYVSVSQYPLPLGRSISVNAPFMLDTSTWYCYGASLQFSTSDASTLSLMLTKPYTWFGYWTSGLVTL